ncbi:MAG: twin-arginine translocase TatA/TatE family subunit [bacterium]
MYGSTVFPQLLVFGSLGLPELLIILVILLLLFGSRRLPELSQSIGQSIRSFKKGMVENKLEDKHETKAVDETKPSA